MGVVYRYDKATKLYNISLRSVKDAPGGDCETLARLYGGGGHYNAAGFSLTHGQMKKWL